MVSMGIKKYGLSSPQVIVGLQQHIFLAFTMKRQIKNQENRK